MARLAKKIDLGSHLLKPKAEPPSMSHVATPMQFKTACRILKVNAISRPPDDDPTPEQLRLMKLWRIIPDGVTQKMAEELLDEIHQRGKDKLASVRAVARMVRAGVPHSVALSVLWTEGEALAKAAESWKNGDDYKDPTLTKFEDFFEHWQEQRAREKHGRREKQEHSAKE